MKPFDYLRPETVADAIAAAARPGSVFLAGGTNLLDLMKGGVARPERVVDIGRLPGLSDIEWSEEGGVRIGALVRNAALAHDGRFAKAFPAVAEALLSGASGQLRNAASVGGNLMQETRCRYFYDTASRCNRREPGAGCDALEGENGAHAVLGWSPDCIATHPSDFCVPLAAFGAIVEIEGPNGAREVPLAEFHRLPGEGIERRTALLPGEMIVAVRLPADAAGFAPHSRYLKLRERTSYAFAVVSAAVGLAIEDGYVREARIALGGVAARPWRASGAEAVLRERPASRETFAEAAEAALADAAPSGDNADKIELARRIVLRALLLAAAGTPERVPALPASPFAPVPEGALHV